jgi:uroporphyrinogen decarboxylase
MGDDVRQTWVNNNASMEGVTLARDGDRFVDAWGIEWVKEGSFNQIARSPLQDADEAAVRRFRYPYARTAECLRRMEPVMRDAEECFTGMDVSPCAFEMVNRVRGLEPSMLDLASAPELAAWMIERAADFARHLAEEGLARFAVNWLWTGDDVGGQRSMIMSPVMWRERVKPHLRRVVAAGRSRGLWVAFHSCGAIRPIIPDLIEIGVQVLNPIQCNCPGMDPLELKREFGRDLAFMGGVDTQGVLPKGSTDEVQRYTRRLIDGMTADGGGYILAASHTVPPETPLDNIFAMYAAAGRSREAIFDRAASLRAAQAR